MIYTSKRKPISKQTLIDSIITRTSDMAGQFARLVRQHSRNKRDYRLLQNLPDYMLADIGVTRAQVNTVMKISFAKLVAQHVAESRSSRPEPRIVYGYLESQRSGISPDSQRADAGLVDAANDENVVQPRAA